MRQSHDHFIATYPLLSGENHLVEVFGFAMWEFGPFDSLGRCIEVASTIFPGLRLFCLPMQTRELDVDTLHILVSARSLSGASRPT